MKEFTNLLSSAVITQILEIRVSQRQKDKRMKGRIEAATPLGNVLAVNIFREENEVPEELAALDRATGGFVERAIGKELH